MIDEGIIIEFMKHIKRQLYEEQARADNADHEGRTKDYFWHAGYISALEESLKEIERATGITGVYGKEERACRTHIHESRACRKIPRARKAGNCTREA